MLNSENHEMGRGGMIASARFQSTHGQAWNAPSAIRDELDQG
jgi:hypothetical protein